MFAGGVGRIFSEFDSFLEASHSATNKKKNKKLYNLLENFLDETACLLNIDRSDYERGKLPWGLIFYNRMLSAQTLLSVEKYNKYVTSFQEYVDIFTNNKKNGKKKQHYLNNARSLLSHLECHKIDPDSVLIGLNPSKVISERFKEILSKPCTHQEEAKILLQGLTAPDSLALYNLGFPGRVGDVAVVKISAKQIKDNSDLRNQIASEFIQSEQVDGINVFGRIKDAVEFNKSLFINVFLAPKEESTVSLPVASVVPLRFLIPPGVSWMGNVQQMRDMVADPYDEVLGVIKHRMIEKFDQMLQSHGVQVKTLYQAIQQQPVSFIYYHSLRRAAPVFSSLATNDGSTSPSENLNNLRNEFISEWEKLSKAELQKFIEDINEQDGSTNKLFMPTCEQDLMRLNRLNFKQIANDFLNEFSDSVNQAINALDSERRELMKGTLKNQLSKWWCLLIQTRYQLLLGQTSYDESAWCEDTYIDSPPRSIEGVRANLKVVQDLLNTNSELHQLVVDVTEDIKKEVYPVIDDFITKAHIVLSSELLNVQISTDYKAEDFNLEEVTRVFNEKKEKIKQEQGEEVVQQYDGLMKDLKYLVEMKRLEYKTADDHKNKASGAKLELSYAVPLSGLIMGCFFRLENVLKTVLELWVPKKQPQPQPTETTEPKESAPVSRAPKPSDASLRPVKQTRPQSNHISKSQFGTISPSTRRPSCPERKARPFIGTTRPSRAAPS